MMSPCVLVVGILGVKELTVSSVISDSLTSYDWKIDTKYYTANVCICLTSNPLNGTELMMESVEAFIIYFDSHKDNFKSILCWLTFLSRISPAVQILVCQSFSGTDDLNRQTLLEWCVENCFELVELEPDGNSDEQDRHSINEVAGVDRIVEALHAHTWSNMVTKGNTDCKDNQGSFNQQRFLSTNEPSNYPDQIDSGSINPLDTKLEMDNFHIESFEEMFQNFHVMKKRFHFFETCCESPSDGFLGMSERSIAEIYRAASLPTEERKAYAEQIALTFWRSIGGDEDEIDGL